MLALKEETCRLNATKTFLTVSKCWTSLPGDLVEPVKNICPQQHKHRQLFLLADCSVTGQMLFLQPSFCISKWDESPSMKFIEHFHLKVKGCKCMELLRKIIIKKKNPFAFVSWTSMVPNAWNCFLLHRTSCAWLQENQSSGTKLQQTDQSSDREIAQSLIN